jgi:hypothetical protein
MRATTHRHEYGHDTISPLLGKPINQSFQNSGLSGFFNRLRPGYGLSRISRSTPRPAQLLAMDPPGSTQRWTAMEAEMEAEAVQPPGPARRGLAPGHRAPVAADGRGRTLTGQAAGPISRAVAIKACGLASGTEVPAH